MVLADGGEVFRCDAQFAGIPRYRAVLHGRGIEHVDELLEQRVRLAHLRLDNGLARLYRVQRPAKMKQCPAKHRLYHFGPILVGATGADDAVEHVIEADVGLDVLFFQGDDVLLVYIMQLCPHVHFLAQERLKHSVAYHDSLELEVGREHEVSNDSAWRADEQLVLAELRGDAIEYALNLSLVTECHDVHLQFHRVGICHELGVVYHHNVLVRVVERYIDIHLRCTAKFA